MSYEADREYDYTDMAILITEYILAHGSITKQEALRLTGSNRWTVWRLLLRVDRLLQVYQDGKRRVYVRRG